MLWLTIVCCQIILGDVYSQKVLDSCNVSVVPLLSSTQHGVKVSEIPKLMVLADYTRGNNNNIAAHGSDNT